MFKLKYKMCLILSTLISSCVGAPLLDTQIQMTPEEKQENTNLSLLHNRTTTDFLYASNIKNPILPSKKDLFEEAKFMGEEQIIPSLDILMRWVKNELSEEQQKNLSQNCTQLVGLKNEFLMSEKNLACAGWWLSQKQEERKKNEKLPTAVSKYQYLSLKDRKNWKSYKGLKLPDASFNFEFDNFKDASKFIAQALKTKQNCAYKETVTALILKLESLLPNSNVFSKIEELHKNYSTCFKPNENLTESLNLRMAMSKMIAGDPNKARDFLVKNLNEQTSQESTRTLFWLGTIDKLKNKAQIYENQYWDNLRNENQLSLFSIIASHEIGKDPKDLLIPDEQIPVQNRSTSGWTETNVQTFLSDLFLAYNLDPKLYANYLKFTAKSVTLVDKEVLMYWTLKNSQYNNVHESLLFLGRYLRQTKGYKFSPTLLKIQYPIVYLNEIMSSKLTVDPVLVLSLMRQESAFNSEATSNANARGLMQVIPATARLFKRKINQDELYNPEVNITVGQAYLARLLEKYKGQVEYVLGAYNAGPVNMDRWLDRVQIPNTLLFADYIPFKETRNYITIILRNYYWYARILSEDNSEIAQKALSQMSINRKKDSIDTLVKMALKQPLTDEEKFYLNRIYIFGSKVPPEFVCKSCETKTGDSSKSTSSLSATDISK